MAWIRTLTVGIGVDLSKLESGLRKASKELARAGDQISSLGSKLTMGLTVPIAGAAAAAIKYASDMEESTNKVNVAFGSSADQVKKWSQTTLESIGVSRGSALEMASLFGDMATGMKLPQDEAAKMSMSLVQLAGDLSSFKNIGIDQSMTALKGIFTGESESLKTLGIVMTEATLNAYALEQGIGKTTKQMTEAEKVQLRYMYVTDRTSNAQGDFARTSGGTANQLRTMKGALQDAAAAFGENLLPVLTPVLKRVTELLIAFGSLSEGSKNTILVALALAVAIGPLTSIIGGLTGAVGLVLGHFAKFIKVIRTGGGLIHALTALIGPAGLAIVVITTIAGLAYLVYKNWKTIAPFFEGLWRVIKGAFSTGANAIVFAVSWAKTQAIKSFVTLSSSALNTLKSIVDAAAKLPGKVGETAKSISTGISSIQRTMSGWVDSAEAGTKAVSATLAGAAEETVAGYKQLTAAGSDFVENVGGSIKETIGNVKGTISELLGKTKSETVSTMDDTANMVESYEPQFENAGTELGKAAGGSIGSALKEKVSQAISEATQRMAGAWTAMRSDAVSAIDRLNDAVISALRRRYENEQREQERALEKQAKAADRWKDDEIRRIDEVYSAKLKLFDAETAERIGLIQNQIDLIDSQIDAEAKAKTDREELARIEGYRLELAAADSAEERKRIQKELDDALLARSERLHKEELDAQKEALRMQIETIKVAAEEQREVIVSSQEAELAVVQSTYDLKMASLQATEDDVKAHYERLLSSAELQGEAERLIMVNNQEEMTELLKSYGSMYEDSGLSLGERFFQGFTKYTDMIPGIIEGASRGLISKDAIVRGVADTVIMDTRALDDIVMKAKADYVAAQAIGDTSGMEAAAAAAKAARDAGALIQNVSTETAREIYKSLYGELPAYASGGIVRRPTLGLIGESGAEAIIPLERLERLQMAGGPGIAINFYAPVYGLLDFEQQVKSIVKEAAVNGAFRGVL